MDPAKSSFLPLYFCLSALASLVPIRDNCLPRSILAEAATSSFRTARVHPDGTLVRSTCTWKVAVVRQSGEMGRRKAIRIPSPVPQFPLRPGQLLIAKVEPGWCWHDRSKSLRVWSALSRRSSRWSFDAAASGDFHRVKDLLRSIRNAEIRDGNGNTPLLLIALGGHIDIVQLLHDKGASLEARGTDGRSALDIAITDSNGPLLRVLHDRGVSVPPELRARVAQLLRELSEIASAKCGHNCPGPAKNSAAGGTEQATHTTTHRTPATESANGVRVCDDSASGLLVEDGPSLKSIVPGRSKVKDLLRVFGRRYERIEREYSRMI